MPKHMNKELQKWWAKIANNPEKALQEFLITIKDQNSEAYKQGVMILEGNNTAWQFSSKSMEDAVNFLITNTLMKSGGMGTK